MSNKLQINRKLFRQISAFICVHLRLIFVSLSDRTQEIQFKLFPIQEKIEASNNKQVHSCLNLLENKPQINADERRFINLNLQRFSEVHHANGLINSPQSMQRSQRPSMTVNMCKMAAPSRFRTRMTRIARIFTDMCALLKVHFCEFIPLGRNSKILETLNALYITLKLFNQMRLKKLAVE